MKKEDINIKHVIESETGRNFNKANQMCCPFHKEKTPSFTVYPDTQSFYCFGCGVSGDIIDFIKHLHKINYIQACKYLAIDLDETRQTQESKKEKVIKAASNWYKDCEIKAVYTFTDQQGKALYYKVKLIKSNGKKITPYFCIENGNVIAKREPDGELSREVPYKLHKVVQAIEKQKPIYIVEGEKDADTLNNLGYTATSIKGIKNFDFTFLSGAKVYFCGDTGTAGETYKKHCWELLKDIVIEFNVIELQGLKALGDNADVTDWLEAGHTKQELKNAVKDAWNWKKSALWIDTKEVKRDGEKIIVPTKSWQNLNLLLERRGIRLMYDEISKNVTVTGIEAKTKDDLVLDIQLIAERDGLKLNYDETIRAMNRIASDYSYNPFIDYLKKHQSDNLNVINNVFSCLIINAEHKENTEFYKTLFVKWLLNVVRQVHNTKEKGFESQGVLVLQGEQGCRKSTFCKMLMPTTDWFKGGSNIDTSNKDSIIKNTKYVLVELGELDSTIKGDLGKLKAFITESSDIIRRPYGKNEEEYPRITTFCATVNKQGFLKDETGNRRFWVIPVERCNTEKLKTIDINQLWGTIYNLYCAGTVPYWLSDEENKKLKDINTAFNAESDISITLDEQLDWKQPRILWRVYNVTEICELLQIKEKKALKNEMERRGHKYATHRDSYSNIPKKGYKLPNRKESAYQKACALGIEYDI